MSGHYITIRAVNFFKYSDGPPQSYGIDQVSPASILLEVWALQSNRPPSSAIATWFHFRSVYAYECLLIDPQSYTAMYHVH